MFKVSCAAAAAHLFILWVISRICFFAHAWPLMLCSSDFS